ncbi:MAG: hypothetical protein JW712_03860 [Dehalococcoidales bacterium]|nr:hypothetical protein [Dehalococcoidales bacterium]
MGKTPKELYEERDRRITDAIQLQIPDRIPLNLWFGYFPASYTGTPFANAWYNCEEWLDVTKKTVLDFAPDGLLHVQPFTPGAALDYLDIKQAKWPGNGLSDNSTHQAIEGEWMKADEYDAALSSMSDYMLRVLFPRISGALEPLRMLPPITSLGYWYTGLLTFAEVVARPEVAGALAKLQKAGEEYSKIRIKMLTFNQEIEKLGFPITSPGVGSVPFDTISVQLRGLTGAITDLYRQPDKLMEFCDYNLEKIMEKIEVRTSGAANNRVFMAVHRGSDGFLTRSQFEKYYWPALKKVLLAFVEKNLVPCPFFEGVWDDRLEYLLELPEGKVLCHFAQTNMKKAKEVLKGHLCIMGGVPSFLLQAGTVREVKNFCRKLINDCGKDGGFILANSPIDYAKPENVKAMIDFTKEYGVYG